MSKQIIFEGSAVQPETREFFLKMAKIAYDDDLNVDLREVRPEPSDRYSQMIDSQPFYEGALNIVIWKERDIFIKVDEKEK